MVKNLTKYVGYAILVLGLIGGIVLAAKFGVHVNYTYGYTRREWPLTIGIFVGGALSTLCISAILLGISEILEHLENIEYRSGSILSIIENHYSKKNSNIEAKKGEWKCPDCGKINPNHVGICSCGHCK